MPGRAALGRCGRGQVSQVSRASLIELEQTLIPHGLHVIGQPPSIEERVDLLTAIGDARGLAAARDTFELLAHGATPEAALKASGSPATSTALETFEELSRTALLLSQRS